MKTIAENAVVTAEQFNASLFSQLFLVRIGVAAEEDFVGPAIQTPALSQFMTNRYDLLVTPDRLQISPKGETDADRSNVIRDILVRIVEALPHTPYMALGLNFVWVIEIDDPPTTSRRLFFKTGSVLEDEFDAPDARFGGYFSKDVFGARLRLNAKPVVLHPGETQHIQLDFNFDRKLPQDQPLEALREMIGHWDQVKEYARRIATLINDAR